MIRLWTVFPIMALPGSIAPPSKVLRSCFAITKGKSGGMRGALNLEKA